MKTKKVYSIRVTEADGREHYLINTFDSESSAKTFLEISQKMWKEKTFTIVPSIIGLL